MFYRNRNFIYRMTNHMKPISQPDAQFKTISDWILDNTYTASFKPTQNKVEVHSCHPLFYLLNQEVQQRKRNWLIFNSSSSIIIVTHFGPFGRKTNALLKDDRYLLPKQQSNRVRDKRRISLQHQSNRVRHKRRMSLQHQSSRIRYNGISNRDFIINLFNILIEMVKLLVFFFEIVIAIVRRLFGACEVKKKKKKKKEKKYI